MIWFRVITVESCLVEAKTDRISLRVLGKKEVCLGGSPGEMFVKPPPPLPPWHLPPFERWIFKNSLKIQIIYSPYKESQRIWTIYTAWKISQSIKYSVHVCQHNNWLGSPGVTCCKPPFPPIMQVFYQGNKDRLVNRLCRVDGGRRGRGLRKVRRRSYFYCPTSPLSLLFTVAHPLIQIYISPQSPPL